MNFLRFFMSADIPNFFMSLRDFFIDHLSDNPIRRCPYQGCSSWITSSFCFSSWSRISIWELRPSDDLAIENIREKMLYPTLCIALHLFSSYTSLTKSVFFIFFFHSLNNNAERSDNTNEIFLLPLELMYLCKIGWCWFPCIVYLFPKPTINSSCRDTKLSSNICNRTMILLGLFENHLSNTGINFTKCSWHRIKIMG